MATTHQAHHPKHAHDAAASVNVQPTVADTSSAGCETSCASIEAEDVLRPMVDLGQYMKQYARENPETAALFCLGVGFILGWRLRKW